MWIIWIIYYDTINVIVNTNVMMLAVHKDIKVENVLFIYISSQNQRIIVGHFWQYVHILECKWSIDRPAFKIAFIFWAMSSHTIEFTQLNVYYARFSCAFVVNWFRKVIKCKTCFLWFLNSRLETGMWIHFTLMCFLFTHHLSVSIMKGTLSCCMILVVTR